MKRTTIILAIITAAFFAGCKKNHTITDELTTESAKSKKSGTTASDPVSMNSLINYKLNCITTPPDPNRGFQGIAGYYTAAELYFLGTYSDPAKGITDATANSTKTVGISAPFDQVTDLGVADAPPGNYSSMYFRVLFAQQTKDAFFINATYLFSDGKSIPVQIVMDEKFTLAASMGSYNIGAPKYLAALSINLSHLSDGIDDGIMSSVKVGPDNILHISAQENYEIYKIIRSNIIQYPLVLQFVPIQ